MVLRVWSLVFCSSVHCELSLSWSSMGFSLLWVSNPRRTVMACSGYSVYLLGTMHFPFPLKKGGKISLPHLFVHLVIHWYHILRIQSRPSLLTCKPPGFFSSLISYHSSLSLAFWLLFIHVKHPWSSGPLHLLGWLICSMCLSLSSRLA